jgi:MFS family permease
MFYIAQGIYGGFGFSVLYSPLLSMSGEWFPQRRGFVTGVVTAGGALGQGLLPLLASYLVNGLGWRWALVGVGCLLLVALGLALPISRWPKGTKAPVAAGDPEMARDEKTTVGVLALAAFLCCMCMGVPVVHMASFIGMVCGSSGVGVISLAIAMTAGAIGRVCFGLISDRTGPLKAYGIASSIQTACVMAFPVLGDSISFMALSALFGFGFAGNMTCLALCVRQVVPANRFGGAIGLVMMVAWAGMASGGYLGGVLFDSSLSYTLSFIVAGIAGVLNLAVIGAFAMTKNASPTPQIKNGSKAWPARSRADLVLAHRS